MRRSRYYLCAAGGLALVLLVVTFVMGSLHVHWEERCDHAAFERVDVFALQVDPQRPVWLRVANPLVRASRPSVILSCVCAGVNTGGWYLMDACCLPVMYLCVFVGCRAMWR